MICFSTFDKVMEGIRNLKEAGAEYNVLCTLTAEVARYAGKVWKAIEKNDFRYVQFTPCLGDLDADEGDGLTGKYALTPEAYADFYKEIFDYWFIDYKKGKYRSIKLFDDIVNLIRYGMPTACGINGVCQPQLVVESNGDTFPCDFYCLDEYKLGNMCTDSLEELYKRSVASPSKKREPLPEICVSCRYRTICSGGCKRMKNEVFTGKTGNYCGHKDFLDAKMQDIISVCNSLG